MNTNHSPIVNTLKQCLKPTRLAVIARKIFSRFSDAQGEISNVANQEWIESNLIDVEEFARNLDRELWESSKEMADQICADASQKIAKLEHELGGGGAYPLLLFLTRFLKPQCVVETGVAAGFSSAAILQGLAENKAGHLFSSDFPYFRIPNPERFIGVAVDESLKEAWTLMIDGDRKNLPRIYEQTTSIDLFHYDSDKTYSGRTFAMSKLKPRLHEASVIVFDDIQDNSHFHDLVKSGEYATWSVFEFEGKYIGLVTNNAVLSKAHANR